MLKPIQLLSLSWLWLILGLGMIPSQAQTSVPMNLCQGDEELNFLNTEVEALPPNVVTANTISQTGLTIPSLWWAAQQYDTYGGRLIINWAAYPDERRVDLVVNRQLWAIEDYIGHYSFVSKMGVAVRDYGYNMRVFNEQGDCLGSYACDYSTTPATCKIDLFPGIEEGLEI
jgi:hypothetical protein